MANYARQQQIERVAEDPWQHKLEQCLYGKTETFIPECIALLELDMRQVKPNDRNRIAKCLAAIGFVKAKAATKGPHRNKVRYVKI